MHYKSIASRRPELKGGRISYHGLKPLCRRYDTLLPGMMPQFLTRFQVDHDFAFEISKKIVDSRKRIFEGMAKGMVKISLTHSN